MPAAAIAATAASIVSVFFTCSPSWSVPVPVGRCVLPGRLPRDGVRRCREKLAAALGARCAEHLARRSLLLDPALVQEHDLARHLAGEAPPVRHADPGDGKSAV